MRLILENFKCWTRKEFDFGTKGLVLLSGSSGVGKTSILGAISFVLYNEGKKVQSFGQKKCRVEMIDEHRNMMIVRTKTPNRLVVTKEGIEYEDDAAQAVINGIYGSAFNITSYVQQNSIDSFIVKSPAEKLEFLERFAFNGIDLKLIKERTKGIIDRYNTELSEACGELEGVTRHFQSLREPTEIKFPIETEHKSKRNREVIMKRTITDNKKAIEEAGTAQERLSVVIEELNELKILRTKIDMKQPEIDSGKEKLKTRKSLLANHEKLFEGKDKLTEYEEMLSNINLYRELAGLQESYEQDNTRLEEMVADEIGVIQKEIELLSANLWKKYSLKECVDMIRDNKSLLNDVEKMDVLRDSIESLGLNVLINDDSIQKDKKRLNEGRDRMEKLRSRLQLLKLQKDVLTCPSCDTELCLKDGELTLHHFTDADSADNVELTDVDSIDNVEEDDTVNIESVSSIEKELKELSVLCNKLQNQIPINEQNMIKKRKMTKELQKMEEKYEEIHTKEEIGDTLEWLNGYKRGEESKESRRDLLQKSIKDGNFRNASIISFKISLERKEERINSLGKKIKNMDKQPLNEQQIQNKLVTQRECLQKINELKEQVTILEGEIDRNTAFIERNETEYKRKYKDCRPLLTVENEREELETRLNTLKTLNIEMSGIVEKIEEYKRYDQQLEEYTLWKKKTASLSAKEKVARDTYSASTILREKISEAESIIVQDMIEKINNHAQEYLNLFFIDHPIVVKLASFRENGKKVIKPQINLCIDYKGMEDIDLPMLSGGEMSRVVLAFTLALAEMFSSPIIMLDECTASLDQELTSTVIEGIKTNFGERLVIIIAHQIATGELDKVITVE